MRLPPDIKRLIVSPPFGTWWAPASASAVHGSYTITARPGRVRQALATIRPVSRADGGGWVNRMGLRNPGLEHAKPARRAGDILSLAALAPEDWQRAAEILVQRGRLGFAALELNLGCPNAVTVKPVRADIERFAGWPLIAKLSPADDVPAVMARYLDWGVSAFHLSNTLPTSRGGLSGPALLPLSLDLVRKARARFGAGVTLIGGGGVRSMEDFQAYRVAGADHVSVSSLLFNPVPAFRFLRDFRHAEEGARAMAAPAGS